MLQFLMGGAVSLQPKLFCLFLLLGLCSCVTPWPRGKHPNLATTCCLSPQQYRHEVIMTTSEYTCPVAAQGDKCPSSRWNVMCRWCCEYQLIKCRCPSDGASVGYSVPCCRNALDQCDPCIVRPGCSLFENCKTCHNGTWKANDDFFVIGEYCMGCRQGWSGGDCRTCGGVILRPQGHIVLESYPTSARCEWTVQVGVDRTVELSFSLLSLESDHSCRYDYVEVRDGDGLSSPVIGRFCGDRLPRPIRSSGSALHILFSSDGYNNFDGFVLTFQERSAQPGRTSEAQCSPPAELLYGSHTVAAGGREVEFSCNKPYILRGDHRSRCLPDGSWSSRPPQCVRACRKPKVSELVRQTVMRPTLKPRYHMGAGSPPGSSLPGDPGLELPDGFHPVGADVQYQCVSQLYQHRGSSRRTCLRTGRWSGRHVSCSPVCGRFHLFSPHSLTDTQWPWHTAIYVRSPPDAAAKPRPRGATLSIHQGASEESTFWLLACSGALLSQRSVLVAAPCVLDKDTQQSLQPTQVRVVLGTQHHAATDKLKTRRHLRVSEILIHPGSHSESHSAVALLKLSDKAKISERSLPVCLPSPGGGGEPTAAVAYTTRWALGARQRDAPSSQTRPVRVGDVSQCEGASAPRDNIGGNPLCVIGEPPLQRAARALLPGFTVAPAAFSAASAVLSAGGAPEASGKVWQLIGLEGSRLEEGRWHRQTRIGNFGDWIEANMK